MGRGRDADGGHPVDPGRARSHGNDPGAVEVHRSEGSGEGRYRASDLGPDIPASGPTDGRTHEEEVLVSRGSTGGNGSGTGVRRYGGGARTWRPPGGTASGGVRSRLPRHEGRPRPRHESRPRRDAVLRAGKPIHGLLRDRGRDYMRAIELAVAHLVARSLELGH